MKNSSQVSEIRKKHRLLSQLQNLKIATSQAKKEIGEEDNVRKPEKQCIFLKSVLDDNVKFQNFSAVNFKKKAQDKDLILESLSSHFIFSSLIKDKGIQEHLLEKFKMCRVYRSEYLMKQNDNASSFFILHEGQMTVEIDKKMIRTIEPGQGFGELALLYSSKRSASIRANKTSLLWYIDRETFRTVVSSWIQKNFRQTRKFIEETLFFEYLSPVEKDRIASISTTQKFSKGQQICKQGQLASSMYIVKYGSLTKYNTDKEQKIFHGNYFGDYATININCKWKQTVITQEQVQLIAIGAQDIQNVLGRSLPLIVIRNQLKDALNKTDWFVKLSPLYQDQTLDQFKIKNMQENQEILSNKKILFVFQGNYEILGNISPQKNKKLFGSPMTNVSESIVFKTIGKIAMTTIEDLFKSFKGSYQETISKCIAIQHQTTKHLDKILAMKAECNQIKDVNSYKVLAKLGEGQFGIVFLVTNPTKSKYYALKCISKAETVKNKLQQHMINQKMMMQQMNLVSPLSVNYIRSYKDDNFIYHLMQYINGLQLFDVIRIIGILKSDQSRFYAAIIIKFLQKIHNKGIIYRDLKPQNIMVTQQGYLKFIDMGTCKKTESTSHKTFTIIGTPNYMAPQIIAGKGYCTSVDLWSLGIIIYEFMAGYVPFGEQLEDPYEIYKQIMNSSLDFPKYMNDQIANSFIGQLLSKKPELRLNGSYSTLKRHGFLSSIQWGDLCEKKIKPAFEIPKNKLVQVEKLTSKAKSLQSQLPQYGKKNKDYNMKWDENF